MRAIYILLSIFSALLVQISNASAQEDLTQKLHFHPKHPGVTIPGKIIMEKDVSIKAIVGDTHFLSPVLNVYINGKGPFHFMYDTGWTGGVISQDLVKKLNLPLVGKIRSQKLTPSTIVDTFHEFRLVDNLKIGDLVIQDFALECASMYEDELKALIKKDGRGIDGILGPTAFYGLLMTIDYKNSKLHIHKGDLNPSETNVVPYAQDLIVPNIKTMIEFQKLKKTIPHEFIIDTGNYNYVHINSCKIPEMREFTDKEKIRSSDFAGNDKVDHFAKLFGNIILYPGYAIKSPYITFGESNCDFEVWGLLGRTFFEKHLITIDSDSNLLKIVPY